MDIITATVTIVANGETHSHAVTYELAVGQIISVEAAKAAAEAAAKASFKHRLGRER